MEFTEQSNLQNKQYIRKFRLLLLRRVSLSESQFLQKNPDHPHPPLLPLLFGSTENKTWGLTHVRQEIYHRTPGKALLHQDSKLGQTLD